MEKFLRSLNVIATPILALAFIWSLGLKVAIFCFLLWLTLGGLLAYGATRSMNPHMPSLWQTIKNKLGIK